MPLTYHLPRRLRSWAAAASILIGTCVWLAATWTGSEGRSQAIAIAPSESEIATGVGERRTILIDGRHEMVLNANTRLRVGTMEEGGASGPLIRLASGEILVHVEHTGRPFAVSTQHGRAVITGTTFAIRADDRAMRLTVIEGSVRLEGSVGEVQVGAGFASAVVAGGAPSRPEACEVHQATAWAHANPTVPVAETTRPDPYGDLTDLWLTAAPGSTRLESLDYQEWTSRQRAWFMREFPWVFRLQDTLAAGGRQVGFPELLVASGDIQQFTFPDVPAGPIARFRPAVWRTLADRYGLGSNDTLPAPPSELPDNGSGAAFSLAHALPTWAAQFRQAERTPQQSVPDLLVRSLRAGAYLVNTRTLLWLYVRHERAGLEASARSDLLHLLQEQVRLADSLTRQFIGLIAHGQDMSCQERAKRYHGIIMDLNQLQALEERVCRYETLE